LGIGHILPICAPGKKPLIKGFQLISKLRSASCHRSRRPPNEGSAPIVAGCKQCPLAHGGGDIRLLTRKALDWTTRIPTIAAALGKLRVRTALLDGEIVSEDKRGVPHFSNLQDDLKSGRRDCLRCHVFDLIYLDGFDLTGSTLVDRKSLLERLLSRAPAATPLRYSEHSDENGATMLKHACKMGLEGIVSKRKDLPYRSGRGGHWLKMKCVQAQEFGILGYVPSAGANMVGSLVLGYYEDGKSCMPAGWGPDGATSCRGRFATPSRSSARRANVRHATSEGRG
jgi:ATP-dependent DNA ligase